MNSAILRLALIGGAALAASGCTTDGYGGYGYNSYHYYGYGGAPPKKLTAHRGEH